MPVSLGPAIAFGAAFVVWLLASIVATGAAIVTGPQTPATPSSPAAPSTQAPTPRAPDTPDPPDAPVRDSAKTTARAAGRSVIRGRVVALDTGNRLRRVHVRIYSQAMRTSRGAYTDDRGNYEFKNLEAGRYQLQADKGGFVQVAFGQRRPLERGRPLELADGQTLDKIDFHLPRGGVIAGRVVDEFGEPVTGTTVKALVFRHLGGQRRLVPLSFSETNDIGQYRIFGLPPGDYYVAAAGLDSSVGNDATTDNPTGSGYAPTYYPGTPSLGEAQRIALTVGAELSVDMQLIPTRVSTIRGSIADQSGRPPAMAFISLQPRDPLLRESDAGVSVATVGTQGTFTLSNVAPGAYYLIGTAIDRTMGLPKHSTGWLPISVTGQDLDGIHIVVSKGATAKGRVVYEGGTKPADPSGVGLHIGCEIAGLDGPANMENGSAVMVDEQGQFELAGLYRDCLIRAYPTPEDWGIGAVTHNDEDITDRPLAIKDTETIAGLTVLLTNRFAKLTGSVTDADNQPIKDYAVIVFAEDAAKLGPRSRFVRTTRADQEGQFKMSGLPPGEYLAAALDTLEEGAEWDLEFLEKIRSSSVPVRLSDGGQQAIGLKIIKPMP